MLRSTVAGVVALQLLAGCASPVIQWAMPPEEYLADCPIPMDPIPTNGDLARRDAARKAALEACNAQLAALRAWSAKGTK
jgi:hypothetical protein